MKKPIKLPVFVKLTKEQASEYQREQQDYFVQFFRTAALFGIVIYIAMIAWDWFFTRAIFSDLLMPRLAMQGFMLMAFAITYHKKFPPISHYFGMICFLLFMANIVWTQTLMEEKLEEGYGMLITPNASSSIIVFSGAEMGYGALLTPLLLLPIAFTGGQAAIISLLVVVGMNVVMYDSALPSAFIQTANSIFVSLGIFTSLLAFLVTQHRRAAFKLKYDLRAANKAKSDFLATMSHEVRTPLIGVLGITELLEGTSLDAQQRDYVDNVKYSGETLLAMLNDILDFSKMEAGKFVIENVDIDFHKLVHSVANLMQSRAEEKGLEINIHISDNVPPYIHSDPTRIRQVLLNLLSNAIKFTDSGGITIKVSAISQTDMKTQLHFEVIDTGIGISDEAMEKLFREFSQAEASTSRKYGGTGLGLSICQKIVGLLGGEITVKSVVGAGSTFSFEISVGIAEAPVIEEARKTLSMTPQNILLVEDNETIAKFTEILLKRQGHSVVLAFDGEEAMRAFKAQSFDLVLMDYILPDMKGSEITRHIKTMEPPHHNTPVIGLTANTHATIIDECMEAGMVGYLLKPIDKEKLSEVIAQFGANNDASIQQQNVAIRKMIEDFGQDYAEVLVNEFIKGIEIKMANLEAAIEANQQQDILQNAHDITSMAGTIGMMKSSVLFKEIESSVYKDTEYDFVALLHNAAATYDEEKALISSHLSAK